MYQKALKNLHNRAMQSSCSKTRMIKETKLLQELVNKNEVMKIENVIGVDSCPVCGMEVKDNTYLYCPHCGQHIREEIYYEYCVMSYDNEFIDAFVYEEDAIDFCLNYEDASRILKVEYDNEENEIGANCIYEKQNK